MVKVFEQAVQPLDGREFKSYNLGKQKGSNPLAHVTDVWKPTDRLWSQLERKKLSKYSNHR